MGSDYSRDINEQGGRPSCCERLHRENNFGWYYCGFNDCCGEKNRFTSYELLEGEVTQDGSPVYKKITHKMCCSTKTYIEEVSAKTCTYYEKEGEWFERIDQSQIEELFDRCVENLSN